MNNRGSQPNGPFAEFTKRLTALKIIHGALLVGVTLFAVVALIGSREKWTTAATPFTPFLLVAVLMSITTVIVASVLHKVASGLRLGIHDITDSFNKYQSFFIMRAAMAEGGAMFAAVALMVSGNLWTLAPLFLSTGALAYFRPSTQEFADFARMGSTSAR